MFALKFLIFLLNLDFIEPQVHDSCRAGDILRKDEDYGEAVLAFTECQILHPMSIGSNLNLAMAFISTGRTRIARNFLETALQLSGHTHIQTMSTLASFDIKEGYCELALTRLDNATILIQNDKRPNSDMQVLLSQQKIQAMMQCLHLIGPEHLHSLASVAVDTIFRSPSSVNSWGLLCATIDLLHQGIMLTYYQPR
jgi:hypothetical protein